MPNDAEREGHKEAVFMLNALWFKPEGGAARYGEYAQAVAPLLERFGAKALPAYRPDQAIIGEFDADLVFFVHWPSWAVFLEFASCSEYELVRPLREEAIVRSLLVRCRSADFG